MCVWLDVCVWPCLTCLYMGVSHLCVYVCQILEGELRDKYQTVQGLVDRKAGAVQEAKQKAERLRDQAKELLKDAQDKLQRLAGVCLGVRGGVWLGVWGCCVCVYVCLVV